MQMVANKFQYVIFTETIILAAIFHSHKQSNKIKLSDLFTLIEPINGEINIRDCQLIKINKRPRTEALQLIGDVHNFMLWKWN